MKRYFLFISLALGLFAACSKDNEKLVTGRVDVQGGCLPDSWLVIIDNPNPEKHSFLCAADPTAATIYNCSNAVFIRLPLSLATTGNKIKFSYRDTEPSCLSYSRAPNLITVKNLSRQ